MSIENLTNITNATGCPPVAPADVIQALAQPLIDLGARVTTAEIIAVIALVWVFVLTLLWIRG